MNECENLLNKTQVVKDILCRLSPHNKKAFYIWNSKLCLILKPTVVKLKNVALWSCKKLHFITLYSMSTLIEEC